MNFIKYLAVVLALSSFFVFSFITQRTTGFLSFSDGAKFADVARNIVQDGTYSSDFSFYSSSIFGSLSRGSFVVSGIPVGMPYSIAAAFKIFGISDASVIGTSVFYYFLLIIGVFFVGRKIYGNLGGMLAGIAVAADRNFLNYATSGASETIFSFIAVLSAYLLFVKTKLGNFLFFISLAALYFARPQGIVFIGVFILFWLILRFKLKKAVAIFASAILLIVLVDKFVLYPLSFKYPVYPIVTRGIQALFQYSPAESTSNALRGEVPNVVSRMEIIKKSFYNLYNFYKLIPEIMSPYLAGIFIFSIFIWAKIKERNIFKLMTLLIVAGTFFLTALTIPFYRYLHPVVPFIYIVALGEIVLILEALLDKKKKMVYIYSCAVLLLYIVGQTLGFIYLDSRFENRMVNKDKPPIYVEYSKTLQKNTKPSDVVITNLDTWGSWYGERKTVWFPLMPKQIIDPVTATVPFDAIYLADYKLDDQNYYMGDDWKLIFENPENPDKWTCDGCDQVAREFKLMEVYSFDEHDNYEKQPGKAILLIKKK